MAPKGLPTLRQIDTTSQLGVTCNLSEGTLNPFIYVINKDIKQDGPQYSPLGDTTCNGSPAGFNSLNHYPLGMALQPVLYPKKGIPVQATGSQFPQENTVRDSVKGFAEV